MPCAVGAQRFFPSLARVQIERTACTDPSAYGLHLTRWASRSLAQVVVEQAVVDSIHYTTVARILAAASLQPHAVAIGKRRLSMNSLPSGRLRSCGATNGANGSRDAGKW
jgi:hypothetical protein